LGASLENKINATTIPVVNIMPYHCIGQPNISNATGLGGVYGSLAINNIEFKTKSSLF
jgi:hypothetical protein